MFHVEHFMGLAKSSKIDCDRQMATNGSKGGEKTGGRKKGTPNKDKMDAQAIAAKLGIDPLEVLLLLSAGDYKALGYSEETRVVSRGESGVVEDYTIPVAVRGRAAKDAAEFLFPKFKTVEFKGDGAAATAMTIAAAMAAAAALKENSDKSNAGPADKGAGKQPETP